MAIQRFGSSLGDDFMPHHFSTMLDRFFNESVQSHQKITDFTPPVDACETASGFVIEIALPGLRKEDVSIEFQEGRLTISGERRFENANHDKQYHVVESRYGAFTRSFQLPNNIDPATISAEFNNGILQVTLPKNEQKVKKHQVQIKGANQQPIAASSMPETDNRVSEEQHLPLEDVENKRSVKSKSRK